MAPIRPTIDTSDIDTSDMVAVHRVFRESFAAAPVLVGGIDAGDTGRVALVADFYANVLAFLKVHHLGEEELVFPLLRERAADHGAVVEEVAAQHQGVEGSIGVATGLLGRWPDDAGAIGGELAAYLDALGADLVVHLDDEERVLLPLCAEHLSPPEWGALPGHGMRNFAGDKLWLIRGLIMEQMNEEQLEKMERNTPPPVLEMWTTMGEAAFSRMVTEVRSPLG